MSKTEDQQRAAAEALGVPWDRYAARATAGVRDPNSVRLGFYRRIA